MWSMTCLTFRTTWYHSQFFCAVRVAQSIIFYFVFYVFLKCSPISKSKLFYQTCQNSLKQFYRTSNDIIGKILNQHLHVHNLFNIFKYVELVILQTKKEQIVTHVQMVNTVQDVRIHVSVNKMNGNYECPFYNLK